MFLWYPSHSIYFLDAQQEVSRWMLVSARSVQWSLDAGHSNGLRIKVSVNRDGTAGPASPSSFLMQSSFKMNENWMGRTSISRFVFKIWGMSFFRFFLLFFLSLADFMKSNSRISDTLQYIFFFCHKMASSSTWNFRQFDGIPYVCLIAVINESPSASAEGGVMRLTLMVLNVWVAFRWLFIVCAVKKYPVPNHSVLILSSPPALSVVFVTYRRYVLRFYLFGMCHKWSFSNPKIRREEIGYSSCFSPIVYKDGTLLI